MKITRDFVVDGIAPQLDGWTFVATLTWDMGTLVTRCAPGFDGRIDEDTIRVQWCDHCKTERGRNDTYLVQGSDGQRLQVGSSCVKDFLGHDFRPAWMHHTEELDELEEDLRSGGRVWEEADTNSVLAWAASLTSKYGWISREKAEIERRDPSTDMLKDLLFGSSAACREARIRLQPTAEHIKEAAEVRTWARELEDNGSEYVANLRRLASADIVSSRNVGLIGSAVAARYRETAREVERQARKVSEWIGQPNEKMTAAVTLRTDTAVDGDWGVRHRYGFTDADGNLLIWWASSNQSLEIGTEYALTGTVKKHEEYREVKSTILTRCKLSSERGT
jgi:hypothetical protein